MKASAAMLLLLLSAAALLASPAAAASAAARQRSEPRVVTKIVKLLESMMKKSKAEGDKEKTLFAKYKCYCDTNKETKNGEIKQLAEEIAMLEGKLEETQASSGLLSKEVAKLTADKAANEDARKEAQTQHDKEKANFVAKEKDLVAGIAQMKLALETLSEVGADQTAQSAADHKQIMKGNTKLLQVVKEALLVGSAVATKEQSQTVAAFVQAPFTGTYSAQSGEIVGILKNMMDTFTADLAEAQRAWKESEKAHNAYMKTMNDEYKAMGTSFTGKQGTLGTNDGSLSTLRGQLQDAKKSKGEAETFIGSLLDKCNAKEKQYEKRVNLRVSEEAAISQAINILNSDEAFATFGGTESATTGPKFLQERSIRRHSAYSFLQQRQEEVAASPKAFLQQEIGKAGGSVILGKIAALLKADTPFDTVLQEIKTMLALIVKEGNADVDQKAWCVKERKDTNSKIETKKQAIGNINSDISKLTTAIEDPKVGLLVQIKEGEDTLAECLNDQKEETTSRTTENTEYQKEIANLVQAGDLVTKAVSVLKKYYDKLAADQASSLLQAEAQATGKAEPAPPSTFEDSYDGQSTEGNSAVGMLEFLLKNTQKEEEAAHQAELTAQHAFEDEMARLKKLEASTQDTLSDLRVSLAEKQKTLREKNKDLEATTNEKAAAEAYLVDIKPGCDFIMQNIVMRDANRDKETAALNKAVTMIKGTPAYKSAMLDKHTQGLGDCADICKAGEEQAKCKACLNDISVPGYCAQNPTTPGC